MLAVAQIAPAVPESGGQAFSIVAWSIAVLVAGIAVAAFAYRIRFIPTKQERAYISDAKDAEETLECTPTYAVDDVWKVDRDARRALGADPITAWPRRWRARISWWRSGPGVRFRATKITDHTGQPLYVAEIEGKHLANRHVEELIQDLEAVASAALGGAAVGGRAANATDRDRVPGTPSEYFYRDLTDGFGDQQESMQRMYNDCRRTMEANIHRSGGFDVRELIDGIEQEHRFPREAALAELPHLKAKPDIEYNPHENRLESLQF
jgi:hypothetical protein